jgi:hypothetical protein
MSLAVAWIRGASEDYSEMLVATDGSSVDDSKAWNNVIKIIEYPRKDCIICFCGDSEKAYPVVSEIVRSTTLDRRSKNNDTDVRFVLEHICNTLSVRINALDYKLAKSDPDNPYTGARFLFCCWIRQMGLFGCREIYYDADQELFVHRVPDSDEHLGYFIIGNAADKVEKLLTEEFAKKSKKPGDPIDMEPFVALCHTIRNESPETCEVKSVQVAKIYRTGITRSLGVMWPTAHGAFTYLGRKVAQNTLPRVQFLDPDSGAVHYCSAGK